MKRQDKLPQTVCKHCGKISISTKSDAKKILLKIKIKSNKEGYLQSYKCPYDNRFYHIGHTHTIERRKYNA